MHQPWHHWALSSIGSTVSSGSNHFSMIDHPSSSSALVSIQRGQSLVEFALMLPLLLLIVVGALDLGQTYRGYVAITNAAREGARYGASHPTATADEVRLHASSELPADLSTVTFTIECAPYGSTTFSSAYCASSDRVVGDQVKVTVSADFQLLALYLFRIPTIRLSNYTVMPIVAT